MVEVCGTEPDEVNEGFLTTAVCLASAGCEAVPEVEGDLSRDMSVRLIPLSRGLGEELLRSREGASWNRRVYWKRDAASASAFDLEGSQEDEKVKSRQAAIMSRRRSRDMVWRERLRSVSIALTITSLSMWKTTC